MNSVAFGPAAQDWTSFFLRQIADESNPIKEVKRGEHSDLKLLLPAWTPINGKILTEAEVIDQKMTYCVFNGLTSMGQVDRKIASVCLCVFSKTRAGQTIT